MTPADIAVLAGSALFLAAFWWWFFGSRRAETAQARPSESGFQEVEIVVRGGFNPDRVRLRKGVPARLVFQRRESGPCTDRVVFPGFGIVKPLPAFASTQVEFTPTEPGEFDFSCGMGMVHGKIVVEG